MIRKKIKIPTSILVSFNINNAGLENIETHKRLNPYVPIIDVILKISDWFEKLKAIKFQGKPVNIEPLKNSKIPNNTEKIKKELIKFFGFRIINKYETKP